MLIYLAWVGYMLFTLLQCVCTTSKDTRFDYSCLLNNSYQINTSESLTTESKSIPLTGEKSEILTGKTRSLLAFLLNVWGEGMISSGMTEVWAHQGGSSSACCTQSQGVTRGAWDVQGSIDPWHSVASWVKRVFLCQFKVKLWSHSSILFQLKLFLSLNRAYCLDRL